MEIDEQVTTGHLLLETRVCRVCNKEKNLVDDYYLSRKDPTLPSSYSYECKECTVKRTTDYKFNKRFMIDKDSMGMVRGLLCVSCNNTLKLVGDNIHTLETMIQYLHKNKRNYERN